MEKVKRKVDIISNREDIQNIADTSSRFCPFCHGVFEKPFVRCEVCGKLSHLLLLMTGPALSMKTVVANYLHLVLKVGLVESAYLGPVLDTSGRTNEVLRQKRRERMISITEVYLRVKLPVILDGAFHRRKDRAKVLDVVAYNYPETWLLTLCCVSRDERRREFRRIERANQREAFELEPLSIEESKRLLDDYEMPSEDIHPLTGEKMPIIFFDTDNFNANCINTPKQQFLMAEMLNIENELIRGASIGEI